MTPNVQQGGCRRPWMLIVPCFFFKEILRIEFTSAGFNLYPHWIPLSFFAHTHLLHGMVHKSHDMFQMEIAFARQRTRISCCQSPGKFPFHTITTKLTQCFIRIAVIFAASPWLIHTHPFMRLHSLQDYVLGGTVYYYTLRPLPSVKRPIKSRKLKQS